MNLLLDTHAVLWWLDQSLKLSERARSAIAQAQTVYVSAATAYEVAIKARIDKLKVPQIFVDFDGVMEAQGFIIFKHLRAACLCCRVYASEPSRSV